MHILMMTGSLPYPPHQGGAIRAFGLLSGLKNAGHDVTLLSFHDTDKGIQVENTPLATLCQEVIAVPLPQRTIHQRLRHLLLTDQADIAHRMESEKMHTALQQVLARQSFDLIQFEGIEIANYLFAAHQLQPGTATIYDAFNAEAALQQVIAQVDRGNLARLPSAIYSQIQSHRIAQFERQVCEAATAVIAVSQEDADLLREFRPDKTVYIVPSGVFSDDYQQATAKLDLQANAMVFTGKMDYRPNVDAMLWFAKHVLPDITDTLEAHLYIVGQKPHKRLEGLRMNPNIEITGWVAEVQPYLAAADVFVAPLRMGSGTRLKLLEAMAAGCAVVATPTAAAGLMTSAKDHMVIAQQPQDMAAAIQNLLAHPQQRQDLGERARQYIRENYNWPVIIPRLLAAYQSIGSLHG